MTSVSLLHPPLAQTIAQALELHPEWQVENPHAAHWPAYVYAESEHEAALWACLAELCGVRFIATMDDLVYVRQPLNTDPDETLQSGIIWYQLHGEGTRNTRIGLTFQTAAAGPCVHLTTPSLWSHVLKYIYPHLTVYSLVSSRYAASITTQHDEPDWDYLSGLQRRTVLRLEQGIESGVPLDVIISQEAFGVVDVRWMRTHHIIPFSLLGGKLQVFTTEIQSPALHMLESAVRMPIVPVYMDPEDEVAFWRNWEAVRDREAAELGALPQAL